MALRLIWLLLLGEAAKVRPLRARVSEIHVAKRLVADDLQASRGVSRHHFHRFKAFLSRFRRIFKLFVPVFASFSFVLKAAWARKAGVPDPFEGLFHPAASQTAFRACSLEA